MKRFYRDLSKSKSFFYYFGWTILVFIGVFFLIFYFIFQSMFYIRRTEKIEIFIAAFGLKDNDYSSKIQSEFAKDGLVEVNIFSYLEDDINIFNYFSATGEEADYIIFSETNVMDLEDYVTFNYYDLNNLVSDVPSISQYQTYKYDGVSYGLKIYDAENEDYNLNHHFQDLIEFNKTGKEKESYYLLVDKDSPNFNKETKHTLGYLVLEYILSDMLTI